MAKKKEIKLESQQTRGVGPGADPSDPVAIIYKDELIASLNDTDDEGVLKTGGTICEDDIFVRYAGSLPPATAADAGKVLTVGSTGAAEWNESSIYKCIIDTNPADYSLHLRGTYSDLTAALLAGKIIHILEFDGDELMNTGLMATANYMSIATQIVIYLSSVIKKNSSVTLIQNDYTIAANGDVTKDIITATLTAS